MGDRILVVGDSHARFWNGYNNLTASKSIFSGVDVLHVGAATAFCIDSESSPTVASAKISERIDRERDRYGCVMFCFGEIDCRAHIIKNAIVNSTDIPTEVRKVVNKYFQVVQWFRERYRIPCITWGPIPSSPPGKFNFNPDYPAVGSIVERNYATYLFNSYLREEAEKCEGIEHISIFESLVDARYVTKLEYLYDGCHLSNSAIPFAEEALREGLRRLGILEEFEPALVRDWLISDTTSLRNVVEGVRFTVSSVYKNFGPRPFAAEPDGKIRFHTDLEDNASITIPLDAAYFLRKVEVHNRSDAHQSRAESLAIALSHDGNAYFDVYAPDGRTVFGAGEENLVVDIDYQKPIRFVKLYLRERNYFHLEHVSIWAPTFQTL